MSYFKQYLLYAYNTEVGVKSSALLESLDEAVEKGQLWAEQDHHDTSYIAIYQLVRVFKDEPTSQEKERMGQLVEAKA